MNTKSISTITLRTAVLLGMFALTASYSSNSNAAQGCGHGFHRTVNGHCVVNHPGRYAKPAPYHRGCWRNRWGRLRCH